MPRIGVGKGLLPVNLTPRALSQQSTDATAVEGQQLIYKYFDPRFSSPNTSQSIFLYYCLPTQFCYRTSVSQSLSAVDQTSCLSVCLSAELPVHFADPTSRLLQKKSSAINSHDRQTTSRSNYRTLGFVNLGAYSGHDE